MSRTSSISERFKALSLLVSSYQEVAGDTAAAMKNMQDFELETAISIAGAKSGDIAVTAADAPTLVQLTEEHGEIYIFRVVLPLVKKYTSNVDFIVTFLTGLFRASEGNKVRFEVVQNIFRDILGDVIPDLYLQYGQVNREQPRDEFAKRRRYEHDRYGSQITDQSPRLMTAENLATLFHHCEKLRLSHEISQLADKIVLHGPDANVATFEHILLPLFKQLPPSVERESNMADTHSYTQLFCTSLSSYIKTYVQSPPQKPKGLESQPRGCSLYCEDCVKLDAFLKHPDRSKALFSVNGSRRDHIEERLNHGSCVTETIKGGTPYTLVVMKKGTEWADSMKDWKQRCGVALKAVEEIGLEKLGGLLGEGWEDTVGLRAIRGESGDIGEQRGERWPLGNLAQGTSAAVETDMDRKVVGGVGAEIVDLTWE